MQPISPFRPAGQLALLKTSLAANQAAEMNQRKVTSYKALRRLERERKRVAEPVGDQAHAGNYRKGHVRLHGLDISIENPRGSIRSGQDRNGKAWSREMAHDYGYIRRTEGADGDYLDVYLGPDPECELVFVVDQQDPATKKFDEAKCLLGFRSADEARKGYLDHYPNGWKGLRNMTAMTIGQFKSWIRDGDLTKPAAGQSIKLAASQTAALFQDLSQRIPDVQTPSGNFQETIPQTEDSGSLPEKAADVQTKSPFCCRLIKQAVGPNFLLAGLADDVAAMMAAMRARRARARASAAAMQPVQPAPTAPQPQAGQPDGADKPEGQLQSAKLAASRLPQECPALIHLSLRGGDQTVCPRCGKEIQHALYQDRKGWKFHRSCFGKGMGPVKEAISQSLVTRAAKKIFSPGYIPTNGRSLAARQQHFAGSLGGWLGVHPNVAEKNLAAIPRNQLSATANSTTVQKLINNAADAVAKKMSPNVNQLPASLEFIATGEGSYTPARQAIKTPRNWQSIAHETGHHVDMSQLGHTRDSLRSGSELMERFRRIQGSSPKEQWADELAASRYSRHILNQLKQYQPIATAEEASLLNSVPTAKEFAPYRKTQLEGYRKIHSLLGGARLLQTPVAEHTTILRREFPGATSRLLSPMVNADTPNNDLLRRFMQGLGRHGRMRFNDAEELQRVQNLRRTELGALAPNQRSALLKIGATANDRDRSTVERAALIGAGTAGIGGAAGLLRSGMRMAAPSYLDLGRMYWIDPANAAAITKTIGESEFLRLHAMAEKQPVLFRRLLAGKPVAGVPAELSAAVRNTTFRNSAALTPAAGDVGLFSFTKSQQLPAPVQQFLTGQPWHHVDLGVPVGSTDQTKWVGFSAKPGKSTGVFTAPDYTGNQGATVRLEPTAPLSGHKFQAAMHQLVNDKTKYDRTAYVTQAAREIAPELNIGSGNFLGKLFQSRPVRWLFGKAVGNNSPAMEFVTPVDGPGCRGNTCGTFVSQGLREANPHRFSHFDANATPGTFARAAGKDFRVAGINLSKEQMATKALTRQHALKYGPLAMRAMPAAALAGLGSYGIYRSFDKKPATTG